MCTLCTMPEPAPSRKGLSWSNRLVLWMARRGWLHLYADQKDNDEEDCPICGRRFFPCTPERLRDPAVVKSDLFCPLVETVTCATCGAKLGPPRLQPY